MRKFYLLILVAYLSAFGSPFVASAAETLFECNFNNALHYKYDGTSDDEIKAEEKVYLGFEETFNGELAVSFDAAKCGEKNDFTQLLEKGDCTKNGSVITEITEVIAPNVEIKGDDNTVDSRIITVYAGTCCMSSKEVGTNTVCPDQTTVYAKTLEECKTAVGTALGTGTDTATCSRRQWVISDSGLGIVKVVVKQIFTWGALTVGSIAVMTIVLNGVRIQMSGVSGDITEAKNKIFQAIAGIVLLFLSGLILYTINPGFFT